MNHGIEAFAAVNGSRGARDHGVGFDASQRRGAVVVGQIIDNLAAAVFVGYEFFVLFGVFK